MENVYRYLFLLLFGLFYVQSFGNFMSIGQFLWSMCIFLPGLVCCAKINLASLNFKVRLQNRRRGRRRHRLRQRDDPVQHASLSVHLPHQ
jgi:hypothetical protein